MNSNTRNKMSWYIIKHNLWIKYKYYVVIFFLTLLSVIGIRFFKFAAFLVLAFVGQTLFHNIVNTMKQSCLNLSKSIKIFVRTIGGEEDTPCYPWDGFGDGPCAACAGTSIAGLAVRSRTRDSARCPPLAAPPQSPSLPRTQIPCVVVFYVAVSLHLLSQVLPAHHFHRYLAPRICLQLDACPMCPILLSCSKKKKYFNSSFNRLIRWDVSHAVLA